MKTYRISVRETHIKVYDLEVPLWMQESSITEAFLNNYPQAADAIDDNMESVKVLSQELTETETNQDDIDSILSQAEESFWEVVKESLPDIRYGGIPAGINNDLQVLMQKAIKIWIECNQTN